MHSHENKYTVVTKPMFAEDRNDPEVLTSLEASNYLRIHIKTTCRLSREGRLPGTKIGGNWRFLKADLITWIRENNTTRLNDNTKRT
jgi:excisionase family DNA binding protein